MLNRRNRQVAHDVEGVAATRRPSRYRGNNNLRHRPDEALHLKDVEPSGPLRVDRVARLRMFIRCLTAVVTVAIVTADPLVTTGAERPPAVLGRRAVAGQDDRTNVGGEPGVVECPVQFIDRLGTERVTDLGTIKSNTDDRQIPLARDRVAVEAPLDSAMVGDIGELESFNETPLSGIKRLGYGHGK